MELSDSWNLFCTVSGMAMFLSLSLYLVPYFFLTFFARPQNLREKYGDWAVVTGGSSGIGAALVRKLAAQVRFAITSRPHARNLELTFSLCRT